MMVDMINQKGKLMMHNAIKDMLLCSKIYFLGRCAVVNSINNVKQDCQPNYKNTNVIGYCKNIECTDKGRRYFNQRISG
jgi:hypothetical protein